MDGKVDILDLYSLVVHEDQRQASFLWHLLEQVGLLESLLVLVRVLVFCSLPTLPSSWQMDYKRLLVSMVMQLV